VDKDISAKARIAKALKRWQLAHTSPDELAQFHRLGILL
jgi:hypothetical protein